MKTTTYVILFLSLIFSNPSFSQGDPIPIGDDPVGDFCVPDRITTLINGTTINDGDTYTIPCGENCINVSSTNLTNPVYNSSSPVQTNLNGLFCLPATESTLTSFVVNITGVNSCRVPYSRNITVIVDQECDSCCDIDQSILDNGQFNNATCGGNGAFGDVFTGSCVPNWRYTDGSPSLNDSNSNPHAWMWSNGGNGEGIVTNANFIKDNAYTICFRVRTDDRNTGDPNVANNATVNLVATNNPGNVTATPTGDVIFSEPMGSYLNNWTNVSVTFIADDDYSQLWVYPFMSDPSDGISQAEMSIDDIIVSECCETEDVIVSVDGTTVGDVYTILCGENCINVNATNLTDVVYNTSSPVQNDLNGLFCVPDDSSLTSFIVNITGKDSCGKLYTRDVTINIESCDDSCCDIEKNLLNNGQFDNTTCAGFSPFRDGCVPYWTETSGSSSLQNNNGNINAWMWSHGGNGEGIANTVNFIDGTEYSICFRVRTDDRNTGDPNVANNATVNLVATNNTGAVTSNPTGQVIFNQTMGPYLNTWTDVTVTFVADDNYSQLWIFPFMANRSDGISQSEMAIDDIIITSCCHEGSDNVAAYVDGINFDDLNGDPYIIPCGEDCINISTGNLLDVNYIIDEPVIQNSNGTFCIPGGSDISSFSVFISGTTTCGEPYDNEIIIEINEECPPRCSATAPTNLQVDGTDLTWDPVPGAISYMVVFPNLDDINIDCCDNQLYIDPIDTLTNHFDLNDLDYDIDTLLEECFVWQVIAICEDETPSPPSEPVCYTIEEEEEAIISVYPNPNNGVMDIKIESETSSNVTLEIYRIDGTLVRTIENDVINGMFMQNWDSSEVLEQGLYFFSFEIDNEKIIERVIIN